ncbi:small integral membrane protein 30 [Xenopus laevis]|uniref:Small integral membrane protein 30 n=2 Tax=Xenopus laevis TaxID=8355 RepID=A0A1L8GU95_XENLA|nr:small integral membrane protein 30 [Xenopus laevis]XP_041444483.1 small integral membrane protein 30 [Xenopus laevis]OCT87389.1 hypothetical protein XELAEV_18021089mg [Xenopus laevis]
MAFPGEMYKLLTAFASLFFMLPVAEAMDEGNTIALLLGVVITAIGFCACLGYYARKRDGLH